MPPRGFAGRDVSAQIPRFQHPPCLTFEREARRNEEKGEEKEEEEGEEEEEEEEKKEATLYLPLTERTEETIVEYEVEYKLS